MRKFLQTMGDIEFLIANKADHDTCKKIMQGEHAGKDKENKKDQRTIAHLLFSFRIRGGGRRGKGGGGGRSGSGGGATV